MGIKRGKNNRAQLKTKKMGNIKNQGFLRPRKSNDFLSFLAFNCQNIRGQLKIQQMIFMLLAITLFFSLVGLFFLTYSLGDIKQGFIDIQKENAQKIVSILSNSAEFSCSSKRQNCIDMDKALIMKDREEYIKFWQVDSIEIRKLYPFEGKEIECSIGNYPNCNILKVFQKRDNGADLIAQQDNYVSLCRKEVKNGEIYEKCDFGLLIVGFEENEN